MILATREESSIASSWSEHLCLTTGMTRAYRLFTGQFEVLGNRLDYLDEETGECNLPEMIDGKDVQGVEDEYIVGGDLVCFSDEQFFEFDSVHDPRLMEWMETQGWTAFVSAERIETAIKVMAG